MTIVYDGIVQESVAICVQYKNFAVGDSICVVHIAEYSIFIYVTGR